VVCPHCGMAHRHYFRPTGTIWRCAGCQEDFPVTSGTIFAFHKLPLRLYRAAAILFANAVKGISALQVGRDLGVSHKTADVLLHKIRESLLVGRDDVENHALAFTWLGKTVSDAVFLSMRAMHSGN
jgi:transposase-like protein